ncbi:AMP-binding protein, partial [Dokdonella sp.]|uniref:AMP-binding protein n=1 Tax=Dokdonella sp. TaxID=2291710 RepID=UPI003C347463
MIRFEACLRQTAARTPDRIALVSQGQRTTYAELHDQVEHFAAGLVLGQGFKRGQRCILFLDNRLENAVGILGTLRAGGVVSVINPGTKADKLAWLLNDCEATILVTQASHLPVARRAAAEVPSLRRIIVVDGDADTEMMPWTQFMADASSLLPDTPRGIDIDLAMLVYTSGSTGHPKGVMMTHRNMLFAATSVSGYLTMRADDVILSVLPLSFDYGLY